MMYVGTQRRHRGFGDAASTAGQFSQYAQLGIGTGTAVGGALAAGAVSSAAAAGAAAPTILGLAATTAIPIIGAALVGITFAITKLIQNSGCGPSCIQASDYANQAEPLIRQNLNAYFALPKPRSQSAQTAALQNFDAIWAQLVKLWSDPALGNAGKRGISDRQAGACTWKQTADYGADISAAGEPGIGQCWNWFSGYRDPIAHDPNVVPDAQANLPGSVGSLLSGGGGVSLGGLALLAGLVIAGVYLS